VALTRGDNTNWKAGGPGGLCFQMEKVNFRWAVAHKTEGRAAQKRQSVGLQKRVGRAAEKDSSPVRPFPQPSLMCSPLAHPVVQPAGPPFCAARQPAKNSCFLFGNTAPQPAGPRFSVIRTEDHLHQKYLIQYYQNKDRLSVQGLLFSAASPALFGSPPHRLFVQPASPSFCLVFCAARRQFTFFIWKHGPPTRPALQLVISASICLNGGVTMDAMIMDAMTPVVDPTDLVKL